MAKLGWGVSGLLALLFIIGAKTITTDDQVIQRLDELKAISSESLKLQKADIHRRHFPNHKAGKNCDYDEKCAGVDSFAKAHARAWVHPWTEECGAGKCKAKEETYKKNIEAEK